MVKHRYDSADVIANLDIFLGLPALLRSIVRVCLQKLVGSKDMQSKMKDIANQPLRSGHAQFSSHFAPMRTVSVCAPIADLPNELPPWLANYPSMMSTDEKALLYNLAKNYFTGKGIIVDAGIFLGASTKCFAEGVRANTMIEDRPRGSKPIASFELGIINPGMPAFFERNNVQISGSPGESFLPFLEESLSSVRDIVDLRLGNIMETMLTIDSPIEILFLDVLKLPTISESVINQFFPKLIPGRSIVVQQDYFNELLEYIKVHQESFGDYFQYLGEVQSSAVFLCTKQITKEVARSLLEGVTSEGQERLASIAMHRSIDPARRYLMAVSKARLISKTRGAEAALAYLATVQEDFPQEVIGGDKFQRRLSGVMSTAVAQCKRVGSRASK